MRADDLRRLVQTMAAAFRLSRALGMASRPDRFPSLRPSPAPATSARHLAFISAAAPRTFPGDGPLA